MGAIKFKTKNKNLHLNGIFQNMLVVINKKFLSYFMGTLYIFTSGKVKILQTIMKKIGTTFVADHQLL